HYSVRRASLLRRVRRVRAHSRIYRRPARLRRHELRNMSNRVHSRRRRVRPDAARVRAHHGGRVPFQVVGAGRQQHVPAVSARAVPARAERAGGGGGGGGELGAHGRRGRERVPRLRGLVAARARRDVETRGRGGGVAGRGAGALRGARARRAARLRSAERGGAGRGRRGGSKRGGGGGGGPCPDGGGESARGGALPALAPAQAAGDHDAAGAAVPAPRCPVQRTERL
ncbi:hypothetical protein LTR16_006423, partial [Cryomyces antarcticus]